MEYLEGLHADLYVSVVSIAELFAGVRGKEEEASLKQFLLTFTVLPVTQKVAQLAAYRHRHTDRVPPWTR